MGTLFVENSSLLKNLQQYKLVFRGSTKQSAILAKKGKIILGHIRGVIGIPKLLYFPIIYDYEDYPKPFNLRVTG